MKSLVRLRQRRERDRTGRFLVEGFRELTRAADSTVEVETLFVCPDLYLGEGEGRLVDRLAVSGVEVVEVAETPFRKASYRDRPEGLLAVARQFPTSLSALDLSGPALALVAESIEKPGNLGTMLRTADAAACTGVVVADPATDPFNPNVVRASLGTLFSVPLAVATTGEAVEHLRSSGVRILVASPDAELPHYLADLTGPVALVVGSEQYGLSDAWLASADERITIPMPGSVDSLNAAMAAGILLFEALRQRAG
ncbi:MAG: TrmH family RNA methyltransferase [Acidimicrobiia bacterium]|nr:MAG: TrmH family RNA methyltransferase [Acidimicrobiia bacterium]